MVELTPEQAAIWQTLKKTVHPGRGVTRDPDTITIARRSSYMNIPKVTYEKWLEGVERVEILFREDDHGCFALSPTKEWGVGYKVCHYPMRSGTSSYYVLCRTLVQTLDLIATTAHIPEGQPLHCKIEKKEGELIIVRLPGLTVSAATALMMRGGYPGTDKRDPKIMADSGLPKSPKTTREGSSVVSSEGI